ncbi:hypothetical protein RCH33_2218 [Flavobacterium daejeonense]|nr:hypothetical protein RCH33_2218 [Flavobacterium daejeonense]
MGFPFADLKNQVGLNNGEIQKLDIWPCVYNQDDLQQFLG